ncbi:Glutamate 5-kinase [Limihaloglobus sulfuriphilus]|uniref:Glutamate 5-kinase n=1 Tax=Limihaloglobus sulfuriphilus TaxID=1851148 RepID=A0A1Q2MB37_9BACT|nr:glutamate 5-kinase [Limihaloglobus sulfuriphilus]AQQ69879.1 Glutamate 5-kinase [Limihaloglobus sulfuriphilus]
MRNFSKSRRIVIKVGTNTLSKDNAIDSEYVLLLARQIKALLDDKRQVLLVSSGAIGMGAGRLGYVGRVTGTKRRQAFAAVGQPLLMHEYEKAFSAYNVNIAQVLVTTDVLNNRSSYLNLRNAIDTLLELDVVPVINENDCVSTDEIGKVFGDNDTLSARVAAKIGADLLIILSDIDAFYDKDPKEHKDAAALELVTEITDDIVKAAGKNGSMHSTGGMATKIKAARIASDAGCRIVLAHGRLENVINRIVRGEVIGTLFLPKRKLSSRLRWILNTDPAGVIELDEGAVKAISNNKSLLPSGIKAVKGLFDAGSVVMLSDCAKAVTALSSDELKRLAGCHSSEIRDILGDHRKSVVAVPEDIVLLEI